MIFLFSLRCRCPDSRELEYESGLDTKRQKAEFVSDINSVDSSSRKNLRNGASAEDGLTAQTQLDDVKEAAQEVELEVVIEEMPKWKILREVLEEIEEERQRLKAGKATEGPSEIAGEEGEDAVLVACKDERMCLQLQEVVRHGPQKVMREEWTKYLLSKAELQSMKTRNKKKPTGAGVIIGKDDHEAVYYGGEFRNQMQSEQREELEALAAAADEVAPANVEVIGVGEDATIPKGTSSKGRGRGRRGRGRGGRGRGRSYEASGEGQKGKGLGHGQGSRLESNNSIERTGKVKVIKSVLYSPDVPHCGENTPVTDSVGREVPEKQSKPLPPVHF